MIYSKNNIELKAFEFYKEMRLVNEEQADFCLMLGIKEYVKSLLVSRFPQDLMMLENNIDGIINKLVLKTTTGAKQIAVLKTQEKNMNIVIPKVFYQTFNGGFLLNDDGNLINPNHKEFYDVYVSIYQNVKEYLVFRFFLAILAVMEKENNLDYQAINFQNPLLLKGLKMCLSRVVFELGAYNEDLILEVSYAKTNFRFREIPEDDFNLIVDEALKIVEGL